MKFHWAFTLLTAFLIVNAGSPSYYNILGLKDNASLDDVKTAFRKLSTRFHPDKSPDDYEKYLQIINAYEVITQKKPITSEPQKPSQYPFAGYFSYLIHFAQKKFEHQERARTELMIFLSAVLIPMVFIAIKIKL